MSLTLYGTITPATPARVQAAIDPYGATLTGFTEGPEGSVDVDLPAGCDAQREAHIREAGAVAIAGAVDPMQHVMDEISEIDRVVLALAVRLAEVQRLVQIVVDRTDPNTGILALRVKV